MNEYKIAIDILKQLTDSKLNKDQPGGIPGQLDALYGNANAVFKVLASQAEDSRINGFTDLLRKARQDQ